VFVDIDIETLNMDEELVEEYITGNTRAILSVSLLGRPANMDVLSEIAEDNKLWLVEDAAQSLGAKSSWTGCSGLRGSRKIGSCGDLGTFSFQESKSITTLGEGGMIVTDNDKLANLCRHVRNHGNCYGDTIMNQTCTNARLTEAAAAFGRVQLSKLDGFIKSQRENAQIIFDTLEEPLIPIYESMDSTYYIIPYVLDGGLNRDKFIEKCKEAGVSKGVPGQNIGYYKKVMYDNPILQPYASKCENAEWVRDNVLLLDVHRWKTQEQVKQFAVTMNQCLKNL
jgi:perosamine synthetase